MPRLTRRLRIGMYARRRNRNCNLKRWRLRARKSKWTRSLGTIGSPKYQRNGSTSTTNYSSKREQYFVRNEDRRNCATRRSRKKKSKMPR